ncbi:MAG: hypothetical protein ACJA1L_001719 [Paracoccaceae bacterium]|jgi:hypothetical protein
MPGLIAPLIRSCDTADEIANSRPAAVDSAAAGPPAASSAITQPGRRAISGLASTRMSLFTDSSDPFQPSDSTLAAKSPDVSLCCWILPSPFLSSNFKRPATSQFDIHCGRCA